MAGKFYAVRKGRQTGIFMTWEECKKQVDGYAGAEFKSFKIRSEAEGYLNEGNVIKNQNIDGQDKTAVDNQASVKKIDIDTIIAYVDGSYDRLKPTQYSYGMVIIDNEGEHTFNQSYDNPEMAKMNNVAGEIAGAMAAMQYAMEHKVKKIIIYHDYEGIAKWCSGQWKTNREGTIAYKKFYDEAVKQIDIEFIKVKGHSNDRYNDMADELAKQALYD